MIKINLLPVRAAKRKETARQQIIISVGSLVVVGVIGLSLYSYLMMKVSATKDEIARSEHEIVELKAKIAKINDLEKLKADVTKKLDVLDHLRKGKTGPAHRLLTLSQSAPDKLWLTDYEEKDTSVKVAGVAFNEELIASLMRSLEVSPNFMNVELLIAEQVEMAGLKLKKFEKI